MPHPKFNNQEIGRRGGSWYERIRPQVEIRERLFRFCGYISNEKSIGKGWLPA